MLGARLKRAVAAAGVRLVLVLVLAAVALALVLGGLGFLAAAAYLALAEVLPPALAAMTVACAMLAVVLLPLAIALARLRVSAPPAAGGARRERSGEAARLAEDVVAFAIREPKTATLAALVLGIAVGASPGLRRELGDVARRR